MNTVNIVSLLTLLTVCKSFNNTLFSSVCYKLKTAAAPVYAYIQCRVEIVYLIVKRRVIFVFVV